MKSNTGARLQIASEKYVARSRRNATAEEDAPLSLISDRGEAMKKRVRIEHEQRISRVETLRAQVRAGTYVVDTKVLAERILEQEAHFTENAQ